MEPDGVADLQSVGHSRILSQLHIPAGLKLNKFSGPHSLPILEHNLTSDPEEAGFILGLKDDPAQVVVSAVEVVDPLVLAAGVQCLHGPL